MTSSSAYTYLIPAALSSRSRRVFSFSPLSLACLCACTRALCDHVSLLLSHPPPINPSRVPRSRISLLRDLRVCVCLSRACIEPNQNEEKMAPTELATGLLIVFAFSIPVSCLLYSGERLDGDFLPDLTSTCLGCICEATTNCNLTIGCRGRLCGPFLISESYWKDAGRPVLYRDDPRRKGAYETCVNDPYCAAATLKQYMYKYAQDCNGNRILDCDDYARIHYLGGRQCYLPIHHYGYYRVFAACQASVQFLN